MPQSGPKAGAAATVSGGGGFVAPETRIFADEINNTLIILATPTDYKFIAETIKKIDMQPRQVVIEGLIARVDLTDNLSFGFSWSLKTDVNISLKPFKRDINLGGNTGNNLGNLTPGDSGVVSVPSTGFTFVGSDPTGHVRALLNAALKDSRAKVLAAPHILVLDNREARIQVGSQVPLATSSTTEILATNTTTTTSSIPVTNTIQYKDVGIILKVKPQVNDSGLVSLELTQEVSSIGDTVKIGGQDYVSINKTEAATNLIAQSDETILIGGLIQETITKGKTGIPFLSKIPLLGWLFSDVTDNKTRTELIILLTPHVIKNGEEAGNVTADYIDRYRGATKDNDINGYIKERGKKEKGDDNKTTEKSK
jgi:general secretion pathway protein D